MEAKKSTMEARVPLGMLAVQVIAAGLQLLCRVILREGTFVFALMAYRHVLASLCVLPFALRWERGVLNKLNYSAFFWIFTVALTGITLAMGLFYYGMRDTTATYATNFLNLVPIVTFILSTILRVEKLRMQTMSGKLKIFGAMLCLGGAFTIALYRGKTFHLSGFHHQNSSIIDKSNQNWSRGTMFLVASSFSAGIWYILQVRLFRVFPYKYWATFLVCVIASLQTMLIGLCIDRELNAWKLGWNLELVTICYSGALATGVTFCLVSWAISRRGPTYPSIFNPISLILVAIIEALCLGEEISLGRLIGMVAIIVGLYIFIWGKNLDIKLESLELHQSSTAIVPSVSPNNCAERVSKI
ncbi:WAT1-related protein At5g64700-like isoform X1 [Henckelia pumila]|uniref:WAT1-related protein At5g64700-like isoform X1 n=1 Tax=Henckelia pumila TaxID=405737 RepID=UPI003C6E4450